MKVVNIDDKFASFQDFWSPKIVGQLNGQHIKLAKLKGPFIWHKHDEEDECFFVIKGSLKIEFRDQIKTINPGEFIIVPKGVEHKPIAEKEVHVMLFEPASTVNTGDLKTDLTIENLDKI